MLALLKRDYRLLFTRKEDRYLLLFFIPGMILLFGNGSFGGIYIMLIYPFAIIITTIPFTYKNRSKVNMFIQSLPIGRNKIVIARYISLFVNFIFAAMYTWAWVKIFGLFNADYQLKDFWTITLRDAFFITCIVSAVVFPILFCIKNPTFSNFLVVMSISSSGMWVLMIIEWIYGRGLSYISVLLCVLGMLGISMGISLWLYNHKDLV